MNIEAMSIEEPATTQAGSAAFRQIETRIAESYSPPSLAGNAIWTISGNGVYAASQWIQIAILAHFGTSVDVGHYAFAVSLCAPIFMLAGLQLRSIQATDSARRHTFCEYLSLRVVTSLIAVATVAALTVFFTDSFRAATFTVLIAINKAVEAVSDVYQGLLQQRERMDSLGRSFIWKGTAVLASFGITYAVTHDLLLAAAATFLAQVLTLLLYDAREAERTIRGTRDSGLRVLAGDLREITWNALSLRSLAARALPLGISMMLVSSYSSLPRLILDKYAGAAGVGLFAAIAYLPNIGLMVVNAIGTAVCPRLSIYDIQRNSTAFWKLLTKLLFFTAVMGVIGIAISITAGPIVLRLLYGQEYALHNDVLVYNMAGALFAYLSTILGYAATARGQFAGQPWAMGIAIFVLWVSSLMLVPAHGVTGASLAVVISSIVWLCCYVVLLLWTRRGKWFSLLG